MSIADEIYQDFEHKKDPHKLWTILQRRFSFINAFMPVLLHNEMIDLSLDGSKDMQAYTSALHSRWKQIEAMGYKMDE